MTATKEELLALAERVEGLDGPDWEVDAAIASTVYRDNCRNPIWECGDVAAYTASLDIAMTLVPDGAHTALAMQDRHSNRWEWELRFGYGVRRSSWSATPALALTAAALRAQAELVV